MVCDIYFRSLILRRHIIMKNHCFYHGEIQGVPQSAVAVSTCDNGVSGYIKDKDNIYHIEPAPSLGPGKHKIYIEKPLHHSHHCGSADKHSRLVVNGTDYNATINTYYTKEIFHRMRRDTRQNTTIRGPYDTNHNARFVELFLVNDFRTFDNHGRNRQTIIRRSQDIANIVSRLYKPLNIYIALVGVETWTERDLITITDDAEKTLENFLHYRKGRINPFHRNDNSQLITGETFKDGVLGKAIKASICTHQFSGGVDMDIRDRMTQVATTVAHELGHNFGMDHDNYSICQCPEEKCIMAPTGGGRLASPSKWSSCSRVALLESFELGMDYCLKNKPEKLYEGPVCGNSFVEEGEQCDCGLPEDCLNKCCNATTCRLLPNAQCATGTCCDLDTCRPKEAASLCRGALDECDLPEFCSGTTEYCPDDAYIQDGTSCRGGQAYCYLGHCKTHTLQCKLLWGSTGRVSDPICFQHLNTNGSKFGNCGYDWRQDRYNRCDKDDVMCGLLHCVHLNEKLMFWKETLAHATPATFLTKGRTRYVCRSVILDVGLDMPDPGMAPDGAKCGDRKVCVNHKCTPLSQLQIQSCPDCHGNGGFGPPYCDEPGFGGSEHSGPVKIKDTNSLLVGMLVLFLIILPLIGVAIFLGYYHHEKLKKWWNHSPFKYSVPKLPPRPKKPPPRNVPAPPTRPAPTAPPSGVLT
ncbi:hypothetical protein KUTeg_005268 [Tegillarca granosa]|uniref:Uncharacterized protein n=1 Tax=Tegillarca granosa TaxID=220873 RepID=A0ABQ9FJ93_TEGGR|nr:hypothetical protein KUTeg_005268 [Tegillarca granosa]